MNEKNVTEIYFSDIIKMFKGKGKIMLALVIIFAILGGTFSIAKYFMLKSWTATVELYVSQTDCGDELLTVLKSESFAESLLLDEYGLPEESLCDPEKYAAAKSSVEAYLNSKEEIRNAKKAAESYYFNTVLPDGTVTDWTTVTKEYERLQENCDNALNLLNIYKSASTDAVAQDPNHAVKTAQYEIVLADAISKKESFEQNVYLPAQAELNRLEQELSLKHYHHRFIRKALEDAYTAVLSDWRSNEETANQVDGIFKAMTVTAVTDMPTDEDGKNKVFIDVKISVRHDRELADSIIKNVHKKAPFFIERTVDELSGTVDATCILMSPYSTSASSSFLGHIKKAGASAFLFSFGALAVYCLIIISRGYIKRAMDE